MSNNENKGIKITVFLCFLIFCICWVLSFNYFKEGYFRDLIGISIGLIGALSGGAFTMLGVVISDNNNKKKEVENKRKEIKRLALIVNKEINSYVKSIETFNFNILKLKLEKKSYTDEEFEKWCKAFVWIDEIYFLSDDIKEKFYTIASEVEFNNKDKLIETFIKIYSNMIRVKRVYESDKRRSIELLNNMAIGCFKSEFIDFRIEVFRKINAEVYKEYLDSNRFFEYTPLIDSYNEFLKYYEKTSIISEDIVELLNELKNVYESY
ncbi:hypothetical protein DDA98_03370 [Clostridium perfringens]|uniref:hypothetical protein n=1 Tax=Clostridium perfringens TaxID=1502 RepID=UPI000D51B765|nr:hypothetical protein [Clostridium perfringens]EGS5727766.1 hypothetical protein [Clostridium perfringens]MDK0804038.1 hypothetical protein [Clostridium perfringens]PVE17642.1 hypothetical protein DDA98_03370 [Clostridium perfringens]